jgi:uncharacterized membrane protein
MNGTEVSMGRLHSIDVLRALAILLMVQIHFVENLSSGESAGWLYDLSQAFGMLSAPLFTFLVGVSLYLSATKQAARGRSSALIVTRAFKRGAFLFVAGLVFAVVIWLPDQVFDWDILTLIGASIPIVVLLRRLPARYLLLIALAILALSPQLRVSGHYAAHWDQWGEYVYDFTWSDVLWGFFANGYFPIFPWLVFPLVGYATGVLYLGGAAASRRRWLAWCGAGLLGLAAIGAWAGESVTGPLRRFLSPVEFYPATTTYVLGALGVILLLLWFLHGLLDRRPRSIGRLLTFLGRYSRFSFTTYVIHHAVHIWPLLFAARLQGGRDPWYYYAEAVTTPVALLLAAGFVVVFYAVITRWERAGARYSLEWMLNQWTG